MNFIVLFLALVVLVYLSLFVASLGNWLGSVVVVALVLAVAVKATRGLYDRLERVEKKLDALLETTPKKEETKKEDENA